jgi:hypothetical protein
MVNYTIYQNWIDAHRQKIITNHELENINAFLQELEDCEKKKQLVKELEEMEKQCPFPQMSKMMKDREKELLKERLEIIGRSITRDYSKQIKPEYKDLLIPIKSAEKLPLRSELHTKELQCLTYNDYLAKSDWNIRYLSGHYHEKSRRLFVQTIGDSYQMSFLQNRLMLQKCIFKMGKK